MTPDAPAARAAAAARAVKMPLAIHGSPARPAARASCSHDQAGACALTPRVNMSLAVGAPPPSAAFPRHTQRSGWNLLIALRARNPVIGQSTVTHSTSYPAALIRAAARSKESHGCSWAIRTADGAAARTSSQEKLPTSGTIDPVPQAALAR